MEKNIITLFSKINKGLKQNSIRQNSGSGRKKVTKAKDMPEITGSEILPNQYAKETEDINTPIKGISGIVTKEGSGQNQVRG